MHFTLDFALNLKLTLLHIIAVGVDKGGEVQEGKTSQGHFRKRNDLDNIVYRNMRSFFVFFIS